MPTKTQTPFYPFILLAVLICLCSFSKPGNPSIVGTWKQYSVQTIKMGKEPFTNDTTTSILKSGPSITFTADSQYRYEAANGGNSEGTYSIDSNRIKMSSPKSHIWGGMVIVSLTEHTLVTRNNGTGIESGIRENTLTTYVR